jgi:hypothetical protein
VTKTQKFDVGIRFESLQEGKATEDNITKTWWVNNTTFEDPENTGVPPSNGVAREEASVMILWTNSIDVFPNQDESRSYLSIIVVV